MYKKNWKVIGKYNFDIILFLELSFSNALDAQHTKVDDMTTASIIKESGGKWNSGNSSVECLYK